MAFSTKEEEIIRFGLSNNRNPNEIKQAIVNFRLGVEKSPNLETEIPSEDESLSQRVKDVGSESLDEITNAIKGQGQFAGQSSIRRGTEAVATASSVPLRVATQLLPKGVRNVLGKIGEAYSSTINFIGDKIGSTEIAQDFVSKYPEAAKALEETAGTLQATGEIAGNILAIEAPIRVGNKAKTIFNERLKTANENLSGITQKGTKGIEEATSKALEPASIMQRVARVNKTKQAKFEKMAGESVGNYLVKRNIFGDIESISKQLYDRFVNSYKSADSALEKIEGFYQPKVIKTTLQKLLEKETAVSSPGATSPHLSRVEGLLKKFDEKGLSMTEINEIKRLFEKRVRLDYVKQNLPEGVESSNIIDNSIRSWQLETARNMGLKNLDVINQETRLAKQLLDDIGAEYSGNAGNNLITLSDWVILAGGDPTAISAFLTKKLFSSKNFQSKIAEYLSKDNEKIGEIKPEFESPYGLQPKLEAGDVSRGRYSETKVPTLMKEKGDTDLRTSF